MTHKLSKPVLVFLLAVFLGPLTAVHLSAKKPEQANLTVWVKAEGKPVPNAQVYIRILEENDEETGNTSGRGKARFTGLPPGKVILQVTATGFKTSGSKRNLAAGENTIQVDLEPK